MFEVIHPVLHREVRSLIINPEKHAEKTTFHRIFTMGGCRCSYRHCGIKSNGKIHMFHYPVLDRVRCHLWLMNAQRYDFLNLKVSQLKNRVVCQHHFRDDNFMNFKKDKLIFSAVPTENGPNCSSSKDQTDPSLETGNNDFITPDDIENEMAYKTEEKANFSLKYGDFLVNGEIMDHWPVNTPTHKIRKNGFDDNVISQSNKVSLSPKSKHLTQPMLVIQPFANENNTMVQMDGILEVPVHFENNQPVQGNEGYSNTAQVSQESGNEKNRRELKKSKRITILSEKKILEPVPLTGRLEPVSPSLVVRARSKKRDIVVKPMEEHILPNQVDLEMEYVGKPDVTSVKYNIQEVEFYQPSTEGQIVPNDLTSPCKDKCNNQSTGENDLTSILKYMHKRDPNTSFEPQCTQNDDVPILNNPHVVSDPPVLESHTLQITKTLTDARSSCQNSTSVHSFKTKVPAERIAVIEEKRKLNKLKLRDMIEFCRDDVDEQDKRRHDNPMLRGNVNTHENVYGGDKLESVLKINKNSDSSKSSRNSKITRNNKTSSENKTGPQKQKSFNAKTNILPSSGDFASLEARLKRMESNLLKKIDENSRRILDLKANIPTPCNKRFTSTQTSESEEEYKKHLFNELSKFISQGTNSLLYEELFIDRYDPKSGKNSPKSQETSKLRKRCRRR